MSDKYTGNAFDRIAALVPRWIWTGTAGAFLVWQEVVMPDDLNKRGPQDRRRVSKQAHEQKYRKRKTNGEGGSKQQASRSQQPSYEQGGRGKA